MRKKFLAAHPLLGTKHKPAPLHMQERSPYYWWWMFLKRNTDYLACCDSRGKGRLEVLYKDFGDVRDIEFRNWWGAPNNKGDYLFAEQPLELSVRKMDAPEDMLKSRGVTVMYVAVNMDLGRRHLQKKFADLLKSEHTGKKGRKSLALVKSTALYPLHRNFTSHSLKEMLRVYDAVSANLDLPKEQQESLWKIGENLNLVPTAMPHRWDNPYDTRKKHATMTMAVSRYYRQAKAIIQNTALGQFPNSE